MSARGRARTIRPETARAFEELASKAGAVVIAQNDLPKNASSSVALRQALRELRVAWHGTMEGDRFEEMLDAAYPNTVRLFDPRRVKHGPAAIDAEAARTGADPISATLAVARRGD